MIAGAVALALGSAIALNWGWVVQHDAASALPPLSLRRPRRSLRALFGDIAWLGGFVVGILGWALYVGALALAPLSIVQGASAGGVAVLAAFVRRRGGVLSREQLAGTALATAGLPLLAVSLGSHTAAAHPPPRADAVAWGIALVSLAALASSTPSGLGIAAGLLYGLGDIATKGATFGGLWLLLIALVLVSHGAAFAAMQLGFQRRGALATAGAATVLTNAVPIAAGIFLFGEHLPGGALGVARVASFVLVVAGAAALTSRRS